MACLKCGRETPPELAFCQECMLDMERYPVKPGTAVQLPKRRENAAARRVAKRKSTTRLEEQVRLLRKRVRMLSILLAASLILVAALVYPTIQFFARRTPALGQNYSSITTTTAPETTAERPG